MSAPISVKGNTGWVKQIVSGSSSYVKAQGKTITDTWIKAAASEADITAFEASLISQGYENISIQRGPSVTVSASYPDTLTATGATDLQSQADADWELLFNLINQRVELNDDFQRNAEVNVLIDKIEELKKTNALAATDLSTATTADVNNNALRDAIIRGTDSYYMTQRVLRQTITVSSKTLIQLSQTNVLKRHAFSEIQVPAYFVRLFNLSEGTQTIKGVTTPLTWLKMPPQFARVSKRKYQIIQEWWEINADKYLYLKSDETAWPTYTNPNGP